MSEPTLFDATPAGSVHKVVTLLTDAERGQLDPREAVARAKAEGLAFLERQRLAAAEVTAPREGKVAANPRPTSARAARNVQPRTGTQRGRILVDIVEHGGATDHELETRLGMLASSVRPRRGELLADGYVRDSGRIRQHQGSDWTVWEPTDAGRAWFSTHTVPAPQASEE